MKKLIAVLGILVFTSGLTACNTFKGMGKDVERGGKKCRTLLAVPKRKCKSRGARLRSFNLVRANCMAARRCRLH
jgi:entericidin B